LTAVAGIKVGHVELDQGRTGCTVVLAEHGAVAGVDVRGGAPGTRETALLDPVNTIQQVHAVVLAGGSAFGIDAASGVMRFLSERGIGITTPGGVVPIVPAAVLFDLVVSSTPPDAAAGYEAARRASSGPVAEGNVGAGAGATVGKLLGHERAMKGGIGSAAIKLEDMGVVAAMAAVNAVGDVIDAATGTVVAGVRTADGTALADLRVELRQGRAPTAILGESTSLAVVATDARLSKAEATKVAQMAQDGFARTLYPAHTPFDGDTVFVLATGAAPDAADVMLLGTMAADMVADATLRAIRMAHGLPGLPAANDLSGRSVSSFLRH